MTADFQLALARGHAGVSLAFDRPPPGAGRHRAWPAVLALALTLPFTVALTLNIIAATTHVFAIEAVPGWLFGAGSPGLGRIASLGPPLALLLLAGSRLRLHVLREERGFVARLTAHLSRWEIAAAVLALCISALFFGHLVADGIACANGVSRAC